MITPRSLIFFSFFGKHAQRDGAIINYISLLKLLKVQKIYKCELFMYFVWTLIYG